MNILDKIIESKRREIDEKLTPESMERISGRRLVAEQIRDFKSALSTSSLSIIAELKKASPSKGLIREDFDVVKIADSYQQHGASCISTLTETTFFQGQPDFIRQVKETVEIPVLRKDFIVDERQINESYYLGADAILLIVAALTESQLKNLQTAAHKLGLHTLVEIHTRHELNIALNCGCEIIGINNRNLTTFKTDLTISVDLKKHIPKGIVTVSESGINTSEECNLLSESGFDAVLIGESLMRKPDPGTYIPELLSLCQ